MKIPKMTLQEVINYWTQQVEVVKPKVVEVKPKIKVYDIPEINLTK